MIMSERDLEDYICNNQEDFIFFLKSIYGEDCDIKFLGRQIKIGNDNIADLIYYYDYDEEIVQKDKTTINIIHRNFIIVELKFRELEPKDLSQLARYMTILEEKMLNENDKYLKYDNFFEGLFISFGCNNLSQEIEMYLKNTNCNITFARLNNKISFEKETYYRKKEYIEELKLDERLDKIYEV